MRRLPPVVLACLTASILAGCGADDDSPAVPRAPNTVVMTDYEFHPRDVRVGRGETLTIVNDGGIAHNLKVERGPDPRKETDELAGTTSFLKGDSEQLKIDLTPGKYVLVCSVPGHREIGMTGTLTVR
jgi:plastocyanin